MKRKKPVRVFASGLAAVVTVALAASYALAGTLDDVRQRGHLQCGINTGLVGFAAPDDKGVWRDVPWTLAPKSSCSIPLCQWTCLLYQFNSHA